MITHDLDDVAALAHRAYLVDGGRVTREVDLDGGRGRALLDAAPVDPELDQRRALLKTQLA